MGGGSSTSKSSQKEEFISEKSVELTSRKEKESFRELQENYVLDAGDKVYTIKSKIFPVKFEIPTSIAAQDDMYGFQEIPELNKSGSRVVCSSPEELELIPVMQFDNFDTIYEEIDKKLDVALDMLSRKFSNKYDLTIGERQRLSAIIHAKRDLKEASDGNKNNFEATMFIIGAIVRDCFPLYKGIKIKYKSTFDGKQKLSRAGVSAWSEMKFVNPDGAKRNAVFTVQPFDLNINITTTLPVPSFSLIIPEKGDIEGYYTLFNRNTFGYGYFPNIIHYSNYSIEYDQIKNLEKSHNE